VLGTFVDIPIQIYIRLVYRHVVLETFVDIPIQIYIH
jgi:hypothetical protein